MHIGDPDQVGKIFEIEYDPDNPILNSAPDQTISLQDPKTWLGYVIGALAICLLLYLKAKIF